MYLLLIFTPLFSSLSLLLFGRFIARSGASVVSAICIIFSFLVATFLFFEVTLSGVSCLVVLPIS